MNDERSLRHWLCGQMHARQMLVRKRVPPKKRASNEPFPGVTYEGTWNRQLRSSHLAGNGKTFLVRLRKGLIYSVKVERIADVR